MRKEPPVTPSDPADPPVEPAAGSFPTGGTHQPAGGVVPTTATPLAAGLDEQIHQARNELYALLTNPPEHTRAALNLWRHDLRRRRREIERLETRKLIEQLVADGDVADAPADEANKCGAGRGSDTTGAGARNTRPTTPAAEASRCPRCEGYEATYHTFEGECSQAAPADEAQTVVVAASTHDAVISVPADEAKP